MIKNILLSVETTLLLSVAALYIVHCPFNKVEESFNTQAVHDVVNIFPESLPTNDSHKSSQEIALRSKQQWDHIIHPGVVPRTFIGAILIGLPLKLAKNFMLSSQDESEPHDLTYQFVLQIGSRFALSSLVVLSLSAITRAIHKKYGLSFRICFLITTISQFHYMFYAGRFIPNTFATILANMVFATWINRQYSKSVIYIALCVIIFRFDTAIFFGILLFDGAVIRKFLPIGRILKIGIPAGLVAMATTFAIDSIFWTRPVWPELEGLYFNVWLNKSHEWGTEPYFWYVYNCLPRILLVGSPFILLADHKITRDYMIPVLAFIMAYSLLPHKELRFILFVIPLLNICVTSGLMNVYYYMNKLLTSFGRNNTQKRRSLIATLLFSIILLGFFTANLFACFILSRVSSHNYPGGQAGLSLGMTKELLDRAQLSIDKSSGIQDLRSDVGVYVDNLAAQTGLSRFIQVNGVYYAKTLELDETSFKKEYGLIYLILEPREVVTFLKKFCPIENNQDKLFSDANKWRRSNSEINCKLPNQSMMKCLIIDNIKSFESINIGGLLRKLRQVNSVKMATNSLDDKEFIRTRVALHIIRCSGKSNSN